MRARLFTVSMALAGCAVLGLGATAAFASHAPKVVKDATTACAVNCTDISFVNPGSAALLTNHSALNNINNLIRITQGSNGASKEDWSLTDLSKVDPAYCLGSFSIPGSVFTSRQCQLLNNAGLDNATTFQVVFNPNNGGDGTKCLGAWDNQGPASGYKMRLEDCGVSSDTVMIYTDALPGASAAATCTGAKPLPVTVTTPVCGWLINGGSDNFSTPVVATSSGAFPSNPKWVTVDLNGKTSTDTQEVVLTGGPF